MATILSIVEATETATEDYVQNVWQQFDDTAEPLVVGVATIAVVMVGYLALTGRVRPSSPEFMGKALRWVIIFVLLLNMPLLYDVVYPMVTEAPDTVAQWLLAQAGGLDEDAVLGMIETVHQAGMAAASQVWSSSGYLDVSSHMVSGLLLLTTLMLSIVAVTLLMLSKLAVGILLAVGPFFLILRLLDVGKGLFEGWLRQLLTFALVPIFVYSLIALNFTIFTEAQDQLIAATTAQQLSLTNIVPFVIVAVANLLLLTQVMGWAGGVGGGIALAVSALSVMQTAGQLTRYAQAGGRMAAPVGRGVVTAGAAATGAVMSRLRREGG